jgi:S-adenosylmethionine hydrolase
MTNIPLITLTSDFGVQTQGVGAMEAAAFEIAPQARLIHLMHGLPEFNIIAAARTLETLRTFPVGYHVCVCDPGVGTSRMALAIQVGRGDILIGPDNGVLIPAARLLGGIQKVYSIENPHYMRREVSSIFHGRDIFAPAAAHLANGISINQLGPEIESSQLKIAAYTEAVICENYIDSEVIQINRFGSLHLNILHEQWDSFHFKSNQVLSVKFNDTISKKIIVGRTFGDVPQNDNIILKDDYGRIEIAKNMGRFIDDVDIGIGGKVQINVN